MEPYENFDPKDLLILSYISKPSGGLVHHVPQGIRAIHLPTGTVVTCETERSQHRNRHLALTELWQKVQGKPSYDELKAQVEQLQKQKEQLLLGFDEYKQMQNIADAEIKAQAVEAEYKDLLHVVVNQYDGDEWSIGANHVFLLFSKEVNKRVNKLREQAKGE